MTIEEYQNTFFGFLGYIKDEIIKAQIAPDSDIETRYITSEGADNEQWIGMLRNSQTDKVDIWLLTISGLRGLPSSAKQPGGVFDKPFFLVIDYYADYKQGTDEENTEREFDKKMLALDLILEQNQECFYEGVKITSWEMTKKIQRFSSASCHRLHCVLNLMWTELVG